MKKDFMPFNDFNNIIDKLQQFEKKLDLLHGSGLDIINFVDDLYAVIHILFKNTVPKLMYDELISWWVWEDGRILWEKDGEGNNTIEIKLETVEDLYDYCYNNLEIYLELDKREVN